MPGQPQLREAAYLYAGDPDVPVALVRLVQRMDGSGVWLVLLNSPAREQVPKVWTRTTPEAAREVLEAIYAEGEAKGGVWEVQSREAY